MDATHYALRFHKLLETLLYDLCLTREVFNPMNEQAWFEMVDVKRTIYGDGEWTPLWVYEVSRSGDMFSAPYEEEICRIRTLFSPVTNKVELFERWLDLDSDAVYACVDKGHYRKPGFYYSNSSTEPAMGEYAVLSYDIGNSQQGGLLINQDLVVALKLISNNGNWIRPSNCNLVVIKTEKDSSGRVTSIQVRTEYLRDYLCARGMGLYIEEFRHRQEHSGDGRSIMWRTSPTVEEMSLASGYGKYEWKGWMFKHDDKYTWREIDGIDNGLLGAQQYYRVEGQLWKQHWVTPSQTSPRVANDVVALEYYVKPNGEKHTISALDDDEFGGLYLFFKSDIVRHVMLAGIDIVWESRDVFCIKFPDGQGVLFGTCQSGKCFCIAADIARMGFWEQNLVYGDNIRPEDPSEYVDSELFRNQMMCEYLHTKAPEVEFVRLLNKLEDVFQEKTGVKLWQDIDSSECVMKDVTRFCSDDQNGFVRLAKNITVAMIERLNSKALRHYIDGRVETNQLKSIDLLVATISLIDSKMDGGKQVEFMRVINSIRQADAHLMPQADIEKRIGTIEMKHHLSWIGKGACLIEYANQGLERLISVLSRSILI